MDRTALTGIGLTEQQLLDIRDAAVAQIRDSVATTGMQLQEGNGTGKGKTWQVIPGLSPAETLRAVKYALWRFDKTKYADCRPPRSTQKVRFI